MSIFFYKNAASYQVQDHPLTGTFRISKADCYGFLKSNILEPQNGKQFGQQAEYWGFEPYGGVFIRKNYIGDPIFFQNLPSGHSSIRDILPPTKFNNLAFFHISHTHHGIHNQNTHIQQNTEKVTTTNNAVALHKTLSGVVAIAPMLTNYVVNIARAHQRHIRNLAGYIHRDLLELFSELEHTEE